MKRILATLLLLSAVFQSAAAHPWWWGTVYDFTGGEYPKWIVAPNATAVAIQNTV